MIVVDASVVVHAVLDLPHRGRILPRIFDPAVSLHAPHLIDLEVLHSVRRSKIRGHITESEAETAVAELDDLVIHRYPHTPLRARIRELYANLTAYDAAYVALAELLDFPLVTLDASLAHAPGIRAEVEVL